MIEKIFLDSAIKRFAEARALGDKTFEQLDENQMLMQPNESSNSIAVIIQHMNGNMLSRWTNFLTEDGEKEWRKRDEEFEAHTYSKQELIAMWDEGWKVLMDTLNALKEEDLSKNILIRTQSLNVVDAINRQLTHYSYHVGQIVYLGRWIKDTEWKSLSIPKGGSKVFNKEISNK